MRIFNEALPIVQLINTLYEMGIVIMNNENVRI
jgi:hypothetical protein